MRLQRYYLTGWHEDGNAVATEDDGGEWCYASDVEELEAELLRYQEAHEARRLMRALDEPYSSNVRVYIHNRKELALVNEAYVLAREIAGQVP